MKIKLLDNRYERRKGRVNASGCTTTCSCCVLAPLGNLVTEAGIKKLAKHDRNVFLQSLLTFVLFLLACGVGGGFLSATKDPVISGGVAVMAYAGFLYAYSFSWLPEIEDDSRMLKVFLQWLGSLFFIVVFSGLSILLFIALGVFK